MSGGHSNMSCVPLPNFATSLNLLQVDEPWASDALDMVGE